MRIGLFNIDSSIPNLALMKLSAWHKQRGDSVEWYSPLFKNGFLMEGEEKLKKLEGNGNEPT